MSWLKQKRKKKRKEVKTMDQEQRIAQLEKTVAAMRALLISHLGPQVAAVIDCVEEETDHDGEGA